MTRLLVTAVTALLAATALRAETFVYVAVAAEQRFTVYRLDGATGRLTHRSDCKVAGGEPGALTVDPGKRFLLAAIRSAGKLASFRIDPGTGALTHLGSVPAGPDPAHLATDRTGRFLLTAYYVDAKVTVHAIGKDGTLGEKPLQSVPTADKAHAIVSDSSGKYLFAAGESSGKLITYKVDGKSGRLTRQETYAVGKAPWWVLAVDLPAAADKPVKELILPGESFLVEGRPAFVLKPPEKKRTIPQPWVLYAPTLPGLPDLHEKWMHERFLDAGVAVAGIDVGEAYGSPKGRELFTALYKELTGRRGFAPRPCLLGRSRGGLWVTAWAAENTDKVAGLAGIYPVFDLRTYPGLEKAAPAYGLTAKQLGARLGELNPIERVGILAKARVPALLIHGDADRVVPLKENSAEFVARYKARGAEGAVKLIVAEGQGHNYWEGFFHCQDLVDFAIVQARAGKEAKRSGKE
jgi:hypothetical protein